MTRQGSARERCDCRPDISCTSRTRRWMHKAMRRLDELFEVLEHAGCRSEHRRCEHYYEQYPQCNFNECRLRGKPDIERIFGARHWRCPATKQSPQPTA